LGGRFAEADDADFPRAPSIDERVERAVDFAEREETFFAMFVTFRVERKPARTKRRACAGWLPPSDRPTPSMRAVAA
jgi:hypothetical protein